MINPFDFASLFKRHDAQDLMYEQLREAEYQAASHQASAEHHQALADMYKARVLRLHGEMDSSAKPMGAMCSCKDRPVKFCPGEWEPGCDLGANEKFVGTPEFTPPRRFQGGAVPPQGREEDVA